MQSLWGDDFILPDNKEKTENVLQKLNDIEELDEASIKKYARSSKVSLLDKLNVINEYVRKTLREHISTTQVIKSKQELITYFDTIIKDGVLAYDTETNNSLDPFTGKIIGLCLYSPSNKPAYVPINHINPTTNERLDWQVSEEDCREQMQRLVDNNFKIITHNGGFDYKFTKLSIGVSFPIYWDTMIACRLINENDVSAALKWQYKDKVDKNHPLYDIDSMFPNIPYAVVDPDIFALYSATDSLMTYKLYEYQLKIFTQKEEEGSYRLFRNIEMPLIIPVAEMELDGIKLDLDYAKRLHDKYESKLSEYDEKLNNMLSEIAPTIESWRLSKEANEKEKSYAKNNKKSNTYNLQDEKGWYKYNKSKTEILEDPINLESPAQLSILLYDILHYEPYDSDSPRSTDKYALEFFAKEKNSELCKNILERRQILTLLDDFINKLPTLVNSVTGKIHCNFNQLGKEDKGVVTG